MKMTTETETASWRPEIKIGGKWLGNGYRFETHEDALEFAQSVAARRAWRGDKVDGVRATETADPPNQEGE
jgi:hypothetical protein